MMASGFTQPSCYFGQHCYRLNEVHLTTIEHKHLEAALDQFLTSDTFPFGTSEKHQEQIKVIAKQGRGKREQEAKEENSNDNLLDDFAKTSAGILEFFQCPVCLEGEEGQGGVSVVVLNLCGHPMHRECLQSMIKAGKGDAKKRGFKCPICQRVHGIMTGSQPPGGTVKMHESLVESLAGYEDCGVLALVFDFPAVKGVDEEGRPWQARNFPKTAYLPATPEGRNLAELLKVAFGRRLLFTVGESLTTGRENVVTFNDIHIKTRKTGSHGYPDPNHLTNLSQELKSAGVATGEDRLSSGWRQYTKITNMYKD